MAGYKVLIADDEPGIRNILQRLCDRLQWESVAVEDGHQAVEQLEKDSFQIFVIDVKMPGPSGIELARTILLRETAPAIIILTGYAEVDQAVSAMQEGVFNYIQKDAINNEFLISTLQSAADFHETRLQMISAKSDREQALKNIEEANQEFQAVFELSSDMIFTLELATGRFVDVNSSTIRILEYPRKELLQKRMVDIDIHRTETEWQDFIVSMRRKRTAVEERMFITRTNRSFPVEMSYGYVCLERGECLACIARDISERKHLEQEIRRASQRIETQASKFRTMIDCLQDGVLFLDAEGTVTDVNQWFADLVSIPSEFIQGSPVQQILEGMTQEDPLPILQQFQTGLREEKITIRGTLDNKLLMLSFYPVIQEDKLQGILLMVVDVSEFESSQTQDQLQAVSQNQRLLHTNDEIASLLASMREMTQQLLDTAPRDDQKILLEMMNNISESASNLVKETKCHV